jgi:glycolate oxidase
LELCIEVGGTITGEHGRRHREDQPDVQPVSGRRSSRSFHAVKAAFDPEGLLNPGKMVPTLHRCAEYGAMRVKGGQLPHPGLPRF